MGEEVSTMQECSDTVDSGLFEVSYCSLEGKIERKSQGQKISTR